jgi:hypothetical protein
MELAVFRLKESAMSTRMVLKAAAACLAGAIALPAMAQIPFPPPPPLPDLHVRVKGFYDWQGDGWVWVPGHWLAPPAQTVRWVSPRYVRVEDGWWYEPAHWSNQQLVVDEKVKKEKFKVKKEKKIKKEKVKKEKIKY